MYYGVINIQFFNPAKWLEVQRHADFAKDSSSLKTCTNLRKENGLPHYFSSILFCLTQRQRKEEASKASEAKKIPQKYRLNSALILQNLLRTYFRVLFQIIC